MAPFNSTTLRLATSQGWPLFCNLLPNGFRMMCVFALVFSSMFAGATACARGQDANDDDKILATVDGATITERRLQRELMALVGKRNLSKEQWTQARSATLERLIHQRVVFAFLKANDFAASDEEVTLNVEALTAKLKQIEKSLEDHLKETRLSQTELEFQIAWQISWPKYLATKLTDENLEAHFRRHRRQFDGTQLRVAHLLLKGDRSTPISPERLEEIQKQAAQIKETIESSSITWDDAVQQSSDAPTRGSGGDIGWIGKNGPMPQTFTDAAFQLEVNDISPPVQTTFGCHLIKCLEVKPGKIEWREASDQLKLDARQRLFAIIVAKHRPKTDIRIQ